MAQSCRDLIQAGINPREILVLLSNTRALWPGLEAEFQTAAVPFDSPAAEMFMDSVVGRFVLAILRIVCDADDYVAHRTVLGLFRGVGVGTCNSIADAVTTNNLNFHDVFYQALPAGVFTGRALTALNRARTVLAQVVTLQSTDTLAQRAADIAGIITSMFGVPETQTWQTFAATLPVGATLEEVRDCMWADSDEQRSAFLQAIYDRLNHPVPAAGLLPDRVRVLTMHGAKGLSAKVVFVLGLEEQILPGPWRQPYPGLILEAARLLYVSITRARGACVISFARTRIVNGQFSQQAPSRFCAQLHGAFRARASGLSTPEVQAIVQECATL